MRTMFKVTVSIQWLECRPVETFQVKALADHPADAAWQVRKRFKDAYAVTIDRVN